MGALEAVNLVLALLAKQGEISALIDKARAAGKPISQADWDSVTTADDQARADLAAAIAKAKSEGR